ncbi:hypothetical protein GCM10010124_17890 [Pilimelia terevasa]|uniref:Lipoprotein n=1 Tax=Pilimelia terevasa TaxID=53372 RepID=A0A8J3FHE4_9ACTN|nr:protealysin inhibitor emfourin [Pilimelia terevasa]GGK25758.1 hypothetical protein GCM10010124_17890 [Pilimelia terevasa]
MRVRFATVVAVISVVLLGGCTPKGGPAATPSPSAPPTTTPAPTPTGAELVDYRRTGGLAGVEDRLTVGEDGRYALAVRGARPRTGELQPEELAELRRVLTAARIASVRQPGATGGVSDGFHYELRAAGRTLRVTDGSIPEALEPALSTMTALLAQYSQ